MKEVKMDWDTYVQELNEQYQKGYSGGAEYALKAMLAEEPYPEDIKKAIEELNAQSTPQQ